MRALGRKDGFTLVELAIAAAVLATASLSMVNAFSTTTRASMDADRTRLVEQSLQSTYESVADVAYDQLLSWNGVVTHHGDFDVTVAANLVEVGLIEVEFTVTDQRSGTVLSRMATYRSGEY